MGSERQTLFFTHTLEMFINRSGQQAHLASVSRARRKKAEKKREGRSVNLLGKYGEKKKLQEIVEASNEGPENMILKCGTLVPSAV